MSNRLISLVYSRRLGSGPLKAVALKLADVARDDGSSVYPSLGTISRETEFCLRVVRAAMRRLEAMGVIVAVSPGGGRNKATTYRIDVEVLTAMRASNPASDAEYEAGAAEENPAPHAAFNANTRHLSTKNPAPHAAEPLLNPYNTLSERDRSSETASPAVPSPPGGGADAPSVGKEIWTEAIALLSPFLPEARSRSIVGKWCKRVSQADGLPKLLAIIRAAKRAGTADPLPYIEAALTQTFPPPPDPSKLSEAEWSIRLRVATERKEWLTEWGPKPGDPKCHVPAHLVTPNVLFAMRFTNQRTAA